MSSIWGEKQWGLWFLLTDKKAGAYRIKPCAWNRTTNKWQSKDWSGGSYTTTPTAIISTFLNLRPCLPAREEPRISAKAGWLESLKEMSIPLTLSAPLSPTGNCDWDTSRHTGVISVRCFKTSSVFFKTNVLRNYS